MEDPPKNSKNNKKTMPMPIKIGAGSGSFGIGGVVLLGGALVTATLVSVFAIKARRQRRSSSEIVDPLNELESMMKISKDFSDDSSPLHLQNPSNGRINMMEMETKPTQNLILDEKQKLGMVNDEKAKSRDGSEDEESEKIPMEECKEEPKTEISKMSGLKDEGEKKQNDEHVKSIEEDDEVIEKQESGTVVEEATTSQVLFGDDVAVVAEKEDSMRIGPEYRDQEDMVLTQGEDKGADCVCQGEKEDNSDVEFLEEEKQNNLDGNFTGSADQIVRELENQQMLYKSVVEEAVEAACVDTIYVEEKKDYHDDNWEVMVEKFDSSIDTAHRQVTLEDVQETNECQFHRPFSGEEHSPSAVLMVPVTDQEVQVEMITKDDVVKGDDDEIPHVQSTEDNVTEEAEESSDGTGDSSIDSKGVAVSPYEELAPETEKIEENMEEDGAIIGEEQNDEMNEEKGSKESKQAVPMEPSKLRLRMWCALIATWCLCHWYFGLPLLQLGVVGGLLFVMTILGFRNQTKYK